MKQILTTLLFIITASGSIYPGETNLRMIVNNIYMSAPSSCTYSNDVADYIISSFITTQSDNHLIIGDVIRFETNNGVINVAYNTNFVNDHFITDGYSWVCIKDIQIERIRVIHDGITDSWTWYYNEDQYTSLIYVPADGIGTHIGIIDGTVLIINDNIYDMTGRIIK